MHQVEGFSHQSKGKIKILQDYSDQMSKGLPYQCEWGNTLEICLFCHCRQCNAVTYINDPTDPFHDTLKQSFIVELNPMYRTIFLFFDSAHYQSMKRKKLVQTNTEIAMLHNIMQKLETLTLDSLDQLYNAIAAQITGRNGWVVDYNKVLTALLGCNTNSILLGLQEQSKAASFYLGPYVTKNLVPLLICIEFNIEAQDHVQKFPSTAEDSGTDKRQVQYIMTRILNKLNSLMEISDTQAAAALFGLNANLCSEIFSVYDSNNTQQKKRSL